MSASSKVEHVTFGDRVTRQQIRDFAHTIDAASYILRRLNFPSHKLRDVVDGLQGAAGGRYEFELSFLSLARRLRHSGSDEAAETYAQRKVSALDKEQRKAGRMLFTIKRGGGAEHKRTCYLDHLTIAANWMMQQARASELWAVHPGKAIEAFTDEAIEMLPLAPSEAGKEPSPNPLTDDDYISRNFSHVITLAEKNYQRIASKGGDPMAHAEKLAQALIRRAKDLATFQTAADRSDNAEKERRLADDPLFATSGHDTGPEPGRGTSLYPSEEESPENSEENISNLGAALLYAARGWRVFPCHERGKEPRIKEWQKLATTDPAAIRRWWRKWPDASVAIATGAGSNLIVLDVDFEKGGDASLCQLIEEHGDTETARVQTGAGLHFYFQSPGVEIRNNAGRLGEGIDIRGDGGYVIAPPSVHPNGSRYEWLKASPVAQMPEWLIKRLTEEKQPAADRPTRKRQPQAKSGAATCALIPEGERNETLFRMGCAMRGQGLNQGEIEAGLLEANISRCAPPLPDDEVRKIAASAAKYPANSTKAASV